MKHAIPRRVYPRRYITLVLTAIFACSSATVVTASAASAAASAKIASPSCGNEVRLGITSVAKGITTFQIYRNGKWFASIRLERPRNRTLQFTTTEKETITVRKNGTLLVKSVVQPAPTCKTAVFVTPDANAFPPGGMAAVLTNPECGSAGHATVLNRAQEAGRFSVWTNGRPVAEFVATLAPQSTITVNPVIADSWNETRVNVDDTTIANKVLERSNKSCAAENNPVISTSSIEQPEAQPVDISGMSSTSGTDSTSTQRVNVKCPTGDSHGAFGCPIRIDNFDGNAMNTGSMRWAIYDFPNVVHPRVAKNVQVANGALVLKGTYDRSTGTILGAGVSERTPQMYGRWEVRAKFDKGRGWSDAILLWPQKDASWPAAGEVDIAEVPRGGRQELMQVAHNGPKNSQASHWNYLDTTQWHTYAVEWTPEALQYYIDGIETWKVTDKKLIPNLTNMKLTMQLDPGDRMTCGGWYDCPDESTPATIGMYIDSVKVWKHATTKF